MKIKNPTNGFSLLELILVLGIMGLLAGLGTAGIRGVQMLLATRESDLVFMELRTACRLYRMDHGSWPEALAGGEIALNGSDTSWRTELAPYLERNIEESELSDGFGQSRLFLVVDQDGDHWIRGDEMTSLVVGDRPEKIWARVAVYSLDAESALVSWSWGDE